MDKVRMLAKPGESHHGVDIWLFRDIGTVREYAREVSDWRYYNPREVEGWLPQPTCSMALSPWMGMLDDFREKHCASPTLALPRSESALAAELKATKYHLEDMRTMAKMMQTTAVHVPASVNIAHGFATPRSAADQREVRAALLDLGRAGFCEAGQAAVRRLLNALGVDA